MQIQQLLSRYPIISDQVGRQELQVLLTELENVITRLVEGAVVEFGCYSGTTSLFIQRLLSGQVNRPFHVYDSFAGLPEKQAQDISPAGEQFKTGELLATKQQFIQNFKRANLPLPIIHKGWFSDLGPRDVPPAIAFAFLDGDYYQSIRDSLRLIEPALSSGSIVVVDDYQSEALPGAKKAVDEWLMNKPHGLRIEASLAIITIVL